MFKPLPLSSKSLVLSVVLVAVLSIQFSQATSRASPDTAGASNEEVQEQRRTHDFDKLRHFLLTSNAEQRAAKRDQQNFLKRKLIHEYLQSANEPDSSQREEVKKRIITFCNSYEDIMNSDRATCG